uniref:Uncharacterized protein n=1 Tax=Cyanothece sp. (strain PCC 7425 / ATCC 29141) TaxID=395961 RepID=B8HSW4_CYAP4
MVQLAWHDYFLGVSFLAAIAGLISLLVSDRPAPTNDHQETEENLLRMIFAYWIVYCLAVTLQKVISPDWDSLLLSLRLTTILSYFLTFSSVICLPLHHLEARRQTN